MWKFWSRFNRYGTIVIYRSHIPKVAWIGGSLPSPGYAKDKKTAKTVFLFKSLLHNLHNNSAPFQTLFPFKTRFFRCLAFPHKTGTCASEVMSPKYILVDTAKLPILDRKSRPIWILIHLAPIHCRLWNEVIFS